MNQVVPGGRFVSMTVELVSDPQPLPYGHSYAILAGLEFIGENVMDRLAPSRVVILYSAIWESRDFHRLTGFNAHKHSLPVTLKAG